MHIVQGKCHPRYTGTGALMSALQKTIIIRPPDCLKTMIFFSNAMIGR
jgi:hypothetical protein